jgi:hypothetical protein
LQRASFLSLRRIAQAFFDSSEAQSKHFPLGDLTVEQHIIVCNARRGWNSWRKLRSASARACSMALKFQLRSPRTEKTGIEILPDIEGRGVILGLQAIKRKAARQNLQNLRCLNPGFRSIDPNHG